MLALLSLAGVCTRLCLLLQAPLYLGYAVAARDFLSFQWDNLLIECLVLAACLPRRQVAPVRHALLRLLLFKLYFESGIAKAQSVLGDWLDGSAMSFYYETAPLPTWPAWFLHQLPESWHRLESFGALGLETVAALLILGPRRARLAALVAFTGFQILNFATASYGFFVPLALALHVFLLDERDALKMTAWLRSIWPSRIAAPAMLLWRAVRRAARRAVPRPRLQALSPAWQRRASRGVFVLGSLWLAVSLVTAVAHFAPPGRLADSAANAVRPVSAFRVANAYHLFGHITRERIEPELQSFDGATWQPHFLRYKPGDVQVAPPFVAPHQPRVDFLLWFHGLDFERGLPRYAVRLLERVCTAPDEVQPLFAAALPRTPAAVRIVYWQYHFATPEERRATGAWWRRSKVAATTPLDCATLLRGP